MSDGYPWYWRLKAGLPPGVKKTARRSVDAVAARAVGSVNHGIRRTGETSIALTLDDGPDPDVTPGLLEELAGRDVRCTFFLLTDQVRAFPDLARRIAAGGHEVALHGRDHRPVSGLSAAQTQAYLGEARKELQDAVQQPVRYYRPPYGAQSIGSYLGARRAGLEVVVWSDDADDWTDRAAPEVVERALEGAEPGAILLFHERLEPHPTRGAPTTSFDRVKVIGGILDGFADRNLTPTTVTGLGEHARTAWFRP
jgi:peptidoglycan/xylan/chitin deacetylase (PgdA/CDA1 family)